MRKVELIQMESMFFKRCPGCGHTKALTLFTFDSGKSDGRSSHCLECRSNYKKQHRDFITPQNRIAALVFAKKVEAPIKCEVCGKVGKVVAHHPDYSKPYSVEWLCYSCHKILHDILRNKMEIK